MKDKQYAPYFNGFIWPWFMLSKEQYKALIEPVGFSKIEIVEENKDRYFSDTDEKTKQKDGTCFETFRRINVTAVK